VSTNYGYSPGYGSVPMEPSIPPPRPPLTPSTPAIPRHKEPPVPIPPAIEGVVYHYDDKGKLTGADETMGNITREYDAFGQVQHTFLREHGRVTVFDRWGRPVQHRGGIASAQ
jgi:YD repeat-containing protein